MKKYFTSILIAFIISCLFLIPSVFANNMANDAANATKSVVDGTENAIENTAKRSIRSNKKWY